VVSERLWLCVCGLCAAVLVCVVVILCLSVVCVRLGVWCGCVGSGV